MDHFLNNKGSINGGKISLKFILRFKGQSMYKFKLLYKTIIGQIHKNINFFVHGTKLEKGSVEN